MKYELNSSSIPSNTLTSLIPSIILQLLAILIFPESFIPKEQSVKVFTEILSLSVILTPIVYFFNIKNRPIMK